VTSSFASRITSTSTFTPGRLPPGRLAAARGPRGAPAAGGRISWARTRAAGSWPFGRRFG